MQYIHTFHISLEPSHFKLNMIPRLHSDPGPSRLDPIWRESYSAIPRPGRVVLRDIPPRIPSQRAPSIKTPSISVGNGSIVSFGPFQGVRSIGVGTDSIDIPPHTPVAMSQVSYTPANISLESDSLGHIPASGKRRRNCFMNVIMAPWDGLSCMLHKCFSPNEGCMRMVLIMGGIIGAVKALGQLN
jgi:hypothetical protein